MARKRRHFSREFKAEFFDLASSGASNAEIARTLGNSVKTVQTHRAKINAKLGVRSPVELVRVAAAHGLLVR